MSEEASGFLSRWARRKELARSGAALAPEPPAAPVVARAMPVAPAEVVLANSPLPLESPTEPCAAEPAKPMPTLADVALLTRDSDYSRFVARGVDEGVKQAAMKKLFTDPHFNVMDGLDTYIADYGQPDPIPLAMLREMNQSKFLRLFDDEEEQGGADASKTHEPAVSAAASKPVNPPDDDPDLRLQQDDATGRAGPEPGAGA